MPAPFFLTKLCAKMGLLRWWPSVRRRVGGSAPYLRYCSDRTLAMPLDEIVRVGEFWQPDGPNIIDLSAPAPVFDRALTSSRLPNAPRGYPPYDGLMSLREAVGARIGAAAEEVLVTAGASGAFHRVLDTFVNAGDRVVLFDPCSPLFALSLRQRRARIQWLPTTVDCGRTRISPAALRKVLPRAKLVVFSNPANPTGTILSGEDLESLIWWCRKFEVLMFCDQSLAGFGDSIEIARIASARQRLLTAGSLGIYGGGPGARVGWLSANRDLLRIIGANAALDGAFVATPSQQWALSMLENETTFAPLRAAFAAKRQYAFERLQSAGMQPAPAAGGFYLWLPVSQYAMSGRQFAQRLLSDQGVCVTPGDLFGPGGANHVRVSLAIDDGRMREGLGRMIAFVRDLQSPVRRIEPEIAEAVAA